MNTDHGLYITSSNLSSLKYRFQAAHNIAHDIMKAEVYSKDVSWILSNPEIESLFIEKLIIFKDDRLGELTKRQPKSYTYLFGDNASPKYHRDKNCRFLISNFENFEIPVEIKNRGDKEIEKFRKFASENKMLYFESEQKFLQKIESHFFLKNPLKKVKYNNTGVEGFSELSIDDMEAEINLHLENCREFMNETPERLKLIKNNTYANFNRIKEYDIDPDVEEWHANYKKNLRAMLSAYYIKQSKSEISFSESFLSGLGFEGCRACCIKLRF